MDKATAIRQKIDIVTLISEYIPLKKMGRNFKSNCPFHNEKSPSFVVSPERQIWHCFGCGKGGDCFTFLMEYEHIEFVEALRQLGDKVGIKVEFSDHDRGITSQKERIYRMNKSAADFYHYVLTKHSIGERALSYLTEKRKIKIQVIETFSLGYAPSSANALSQYLMSKKGFTRQELIDAGLSTLRNGQIFDFFFNRIMFPLTDHRGNIIGFSGRVMEDPLPGSGQVHSKYVNTRETLVYHKGDVFFGLHIAKDEIKKEEAALIMEGEFDVISSFQEGVGNAIAIKGTAFTENQATLISRFAQKIILCFDQDSAGFEAIKRSIPILEKKGLATFILVLENGKDPDESIKDNPLLYKKAVKHPVGVYDFFLDKLLQLYDRKTVEGKKKITDELLPLFDSIENEIIKEHYLKRLAQELDASLESIFRQLEKIRSSKSQSIIVTGTTRTSKTKVEVLEQYILALIFQSINQSQAIEVAFRALTPFQLSTPSYEKLLQELKTHLEKKGSFDSAFFVNQLPKELVSAFDESYLLPLPKFERENGQVKELEKSLQNLKKYYVKDKIKQISEKIRLKEKEAYQGKEKDLEILQQELASCITLLSSEMV